MKRVMLLMISPLLILTAVLWAKPQQPHLAETGPTPIELAVSPMAPEAAGNLSSKNTPPPTDEKEEKPSQQQLIKYAMNLLGTPYVYAGISPKGFDCSGFVTYVFKKFNIGVPHSSALQAKEGVQVKREEAKAGDVVIFTGTNPKVRKPGHVGIIISTENDTIEFVHSSSVGGVKVSKVEGTGYSRRFLQIRRIL